MKYGTYNKRVTRRVQQKNEGVSNLTHPHFNYNNLGSVSSRASL